MSARKQVVLTTLSKPEPAAFRIAPTFPSVEDISLAAKIFCVCCKLAIAEKQFSEQN